MGRFEYDNEGDVYSVLAMGRHVYNLKRHLESPKGQATLKELRQALLDMPEKRLIHGYLAYVRTEGELLEEKEEFCTIGVLAKARGVPISELETHVDEYGFDQFEEEEQTRGIGEKIGLPGCLTIELAFENDGYPWPQNEKPEERWRRMLRWVNGWIRE